MQKKYSFCVLCDFLRLDSALHDILQNSRSQVAQWIEQEIVFVNNQVAKKSKILKTRDMINIIMPQHDANMQNTDFSDIQIEVIAETENYLILNNGSYIYDVENDIGIDIGHIDKNTLIKITNNFKDFAEEIDYCSLNKYYIYKKENVENRSFRVKIKSIEDIKEVIVRMNIFLSSNEEISKCRKYIESEFEDLNVFEMLDTDNNSFKKWIALNPKGIDKFKALEVLCNKIGINLDEVIFFGDSANDLSIINKVGLGVAMGNALTEVKKQAKEITLSNDEDGIAVFLDKILK